MEKLGIDLKLVVEICKELTKERKIEDMSFKAYTISLKPEDATKGFSLLANCGQVTRLPNDTYIVGKKHLALLKEAKIPYIIRKN